MNRIIMFFLLLICLGCTNRIYKNSQIYDQNIEATVKGIIYSEKGSKQSFLSNIKVIPGEYYYVSFNEVLGIPLAYYVWKKGKWTYWTPAGKQKGQGDFIPGLGLEEISIHTLFSFLWDDSRNHLWTRTRTKQGMVETVYKINPQFQDGKIPEIVEMYLNERQIFEMKLLKYDKK